MLLPSPYSCKYLFFIINMNLIFVSNMVALHRNTADKTELFTIADDGSLLNLGKQYKTTLVQDHKFRVNICSIENEPAGKMWCCFGLVF